MKKFTVRLALAVGIGVMAMAGPAAAAPVHVQGGPACIGCW